MNQCDGCQRGLPIVENIRGSKVHIGNGYDRIGCTANRYKLELEPMVKDTWVDDKARKKTEAPFTFGGGR